MNAFSNIRVLDLTHVIAGPFCAYQLAVLGAQVIKIEPPNSDNPHCPDMSRESGAPGRYGRSDFVAQNANKLSLAVDLKTPKGIEIINRLIVGADVLVENYCVGVMAQLGLDYQSVKKIRNDIIYCSLTGFGQHGPLANRPAYDNVIQAYSGLMAATGDAKSAPMKIGPPVLDYGSGMQAAFAIAAALYRRSVCGRGQYIDVAMLDAAVMLMSSAVTFYQQSGALASVSGNDNPTNAGYSCYRTADGLLMLGAYTGIQTKNMWVVLGDEKYGKKFAPMSPAQLEKYASDRPRIAKKLLTKTADKWEIEFNKNHVPAARVRGLDETLRDPQLNYRAVLQPIGDAKQALPTTAFEFAKDKPALTAPPPQLGQHTREILNDVGYRDDELAVLEKRGVIQIADAK